MYSCIGLSVYVFVLSLMLRKSHIIQCRYISKSAAYIGPHKPNYPDIPYPKNKEGINA